MNIPPKKRITPFESTLFTFGWNNQQLLSSHEDKFIASPHEVNLTQHIGDDAKIQLMASGGSHGLIYTTHKHDEHQHKLFSFGRNFAFQLGTGDNNDSLNPKRLDLASILKENEHIISMDCGDRHSAIVTNLGRCLTWGANAQGQCGAGQRQHVQTPQIVQLLGSKRIVKVVCGSRHSIFMTKKGNLFACGNNTFGQLGNGENKDALYPVQVDQQDSWQAIHVDAQGYQNAALSKDYSVYVWGGKTFKEGRDEGSAFAVNAPRKVCHNILGRRVVSVACGSTHYLCLTSDGSVFVFGHNLSRVGYIKYLPNIYHVYKNEPDTEKQAQQLLPVEVEWRKQIDLSSKHVVELDAHTILYRLEFLPSNDRIVQVHCADHVSYFITESGKVYTMGESQFYELGLGSETKESLKPRQVEELRSEFVSDIVPGCWHAFALCGSFAQFSSRHLELGQSVPKCLERIEHQIKDEEKE